VRLIGERYDIDVTLKDGKGRTPLEFVEGRIQEVSTKI
jgi:hypothetical protein